jgi:hypothetical protein
MTCRELGGRESSNFNETVIGKIKVMRNIVSVVIAKLDGGGTAPQQMNDASDYNLSQPLPHQSLCLLQHLHAGATKFTRSCMH